MPRKFILIKELYAKSPFPEGQIRFVVKRRDKDQPIHSQIQFSPKPISSSPGEYMEFSFETSQSNELGLFVIAISQSSRVVNLGCIHLCLEENVWEKKEYLKGIIQQNGFVIYSSRDEAFPEKAGSNSPKGESVAVSWRQQTVRQSENKSQGKKPFSLQQTPFRLLEDSGDKRNLLSKTARNESPQQFHQLYNSSSISIPCYSTHIQESKCLSEMSKPQGLRDSQKVANCDLISCSVRSNCNDAYQQVATLLQQHKLKNSQYKQHLMQMEAEFQQQQLKLKQLGLSHT